jgi:hypothetical protein
MQVVVARLALCVRLDGYGVAPRQICAIKVRRLTTRHTGRDDRALRQAAPSLLDLAEVKVWSQP